MPGAIDIVTIIIMSAAAGLLYRKTLSNRAAILSRRAGKLLRVEGEEGSRRPVVLLARDNPENVEGLGDRLYSLAMRTPAPVSIFYSYIPVEKSRLVETLEEEIKRVEFKYSTTRLGRYRSALALLESLYKEAVATGSPRLGRLGAVVWIEEGADDSKAIQFKSMLEAEVGVKFDVVAGDWSPASLAEAGARHLNPRFRPEGSIPRGGEILLGVSAETGGPVALRWPRDLEAHMLVVGPTGRGKTVLLAGLAVQLALLSEVEGDPLGVVVVDPKGDLAELLEPLTTFLLEPRDTGQLPVPGATIPPVSPLTVYSLRRLEGSDRNAAAQAVASSLVEYALSPGGRGRLVLIVDEAWRLSRSTSFFEGIAREGRSRGLYGVFATQSPGDLPEAIEFNAGVVAAFGGKARGYVESVSRLGVGGGLVELGVGEAVVRMPGGRLQTVRIPPFNEYLKKARGTNGVEG
ncbi:hypothetical protein APE_0219 [Aeropyrum pernix K1]|uniref:AAA+ ATPase domain-containing protein n=1 Tax=Aeropyrum pernix (strain ATCC 700893 / DSM 11879 / JCM 9820 / NBRC 100138 / K1) TaxID=272557 RepID=Q9YFN0_AERPE|nr:ATP-binding protein [Aeropyrum pernix]BAA79131.1 hypothetical protein APE_0219 [Aeropyrum pernix K1]